MFAIGTVAIVVHDAFGVGVVEFAIASRPGPRPDDPYER